MHTHFFEFYTWMTLEFKQFGSMILNPGKIFLRLTQRFMLSSFVHHVASISHQSLA